MDGLLSTITNVTSNAIEMEVTPRQHSSGDRTAMMGIAKRGSQPLRTLLVHGDSMPIEEAWCRGRDSNPHGALAPEILSRSGLLITA